jgi:hypothetical protein
VPHPVAFCDSDAHRVVARLPISIPLPAVLILKRLIPIRTPETMSYFSGEVPFLQSLSAGTRKKSVGGYPIHPMAVQKTVPVKTHRVVKAGAIYFALVFGAGFLLGTIRVLWLVPAVGSRTAELLEMPAMLMVIIISARWVVRHFGEAMRSGTICAQRPAGRSDKWSLTPWLGIGVIALALILLSDFTVVLWIRGLSLSQYIEAFDPVAGTAYFVMLGLFAVMPLLVALASRRLDRSLCEKCGLV